MVPVPIPAPYLDHKKQIFQQKKAQKYFAFLNKMMFYKEKVYKFQQIYCKI